MKNTSFKVAWIAVSGLLCLFASPALAGWGSSGGYYGGSSGNSAYYGSYGSGGGSYGGHHFTPVRSALRGIHNHFAAKIERHQARRAYYSSYGSSGYSTSYGSSGYSTSYGSSGYSTSYGSSGYSTSYGSSGYSTSYGSSGSVSYGSTGVSYGSTGTSYGSSGVSYGSTGTSSGSTGSYGAGYGSSDGVIYYGASNTTSSPVLAASSSTQNDAVYLTVNVPSAAKVFVNDKLTTSTGSVRQFVSRGLVAGKSYKFDVRAELMTADGQVVTEHKTMVVGAGADEQVQFAFAETKSNIQTSLTLNVPENSRVTLAGNSTKAVGSQRVFQSSHLKLGEAWDDYVVEVEHDGKIKRQAIRLIGGDQLALTFDFDQTDQLASR